MAWIQTIEPQRATGLLRKLYDEAVRRAGKVFEVVRLQSLRPRVLRASTLLYTELMLGREGALDRARREMIATVVSSVNACHY